MTSAKQKNLVMIVILGALTTVSPFSIDMYLPAFSQIARDLGTTTPTVALSLSSYFIGLAIGQIFYGPLLDRFGRKKPVYVGLAVYILASLGCVCASSVNMLIAFRFIQALGGCVAGVASTAIVRDFFPPKERAKVFSLMMLILGTSPLLAPTIGGVVTTAWGWHAVFIILSMIVTLLLMVTVFYLPEPHKPDASVSLRLKPIMRNFTIILKEPQFYTYAIAGAFSFAGLFAYVAGSPVIFMDIFKLTAQQYGGIFALLSIGFIGASQLNIWLLRHYRNEQIFRTALICQLIIGTIFMVGSFGSGYGLLATFFIIFGFLACVGLIYPNAAALALEPFTRNTGSASALLGFLQIGCGAIASAAVGFFEAQSSLPTACIFMISVIISVLILTFGKRNIVCSGH